MEENGMNSNEGIKKVYWWDNRILNKGHMRICLKVNAGFETMITTPSESLLLKAAHLIICQSKMDCPTTFKGILGRFSVHRGELWVHYFFDHYQQCCGFCNSVCSIIETTILLASLWYVRQ